MPLTLQLAQAPRCPAAEIAQAIFSPHDADMECRIAGQVMPIGLRECNADYADCTIWKRNKIERDEDSSRHVIRSLEDNRATHTIDGVERPTAHG